jgi:hypothetical protein
MSHHDQIRALAFSETDRVFAGAHNINQFVAKLVKNEL